MEPFPEKEALIPPPFLAVELLITWLLDTVTVVASPLNDKPWSELPFMRLSETVKTEPPALTLAPFEELPINSFWVKKISELDEAKIPDAPLFVEMLLVIYVDAAVADVT